METQAAEARVCPECGDPSPERRPGIGGVRPSYHPKCRKRKQKRATRARLKAQRQAAHAERRRTCLRCGVVFQPLIHQHGQQVYCSRECRIDAPPKPGGPYSKLSQRPEQRTFYAGSCGWCNAAFTTTLQWARFCSAHCKRRAKAARMGARAQAFIDAHKAKAGCMVCGLTSPPYALDLHHVDPTTKAFNLSKATSLNRAVLDEVDKCVVLCAVHHRMVEAGDIEPPALGVSKPDPPQLTLVPLAEDATLANTSQVA